jgi:hypothetical protein
MAMSIPIFLVIVASGARSFSLSFRADHFVILFTTLKEDTLLKYFMQ